MRDANMKVLQNFLFLLEDGDFDFEEDLGAFNNFDSLFYLKINWERVI